MRDTRGKFSGKTVALHWVVALGVISMLAVGTYMVEFKAYSLYPIHKSLGMILFLIILMRVIWRITNGWPENISAGSELEHKLAKVAHWVLIVGTVLMPISGMVMSQMGGFGLDVFGLQLMDPNISAETGKNVPINKGLAGTANFIHETISTIVIITVVLHVLGAIKHHVMDRDGTLRRMLGKEVS